jgi:hypothetical protein
MIKLYNRTRYEDRPIEDLLAYAAKLVRVEGNVAVVVNSGYRSSGIAYKSFPYINYLRGTRSAQWPNAGLLKSCPIGFVKITLGRWSRGQEIEAARSFFRVALHEMGHIRDFRSGDYDRRTEPRTPTGRRIRHSKRLCEIVANNYRDEAADRAETKRVDDLVLALALEIERKR